MSLVLENSYSRSENLKSWRIRPCSAEPLRGGHKEEADKVIGSLNVYATHQHWPELCVYMRGKWSKPGV